VLETAGEHLHYRVIYERLVGQGLEPPVSQDPAQAVLSRYYNDPRLSRVRRGTYGLKRWENIGPSMSIKPPEPFPYEGEIDTPAQANAPKVDYTGTKPAAFILMSQRFPLKKSDWIEVLAGLCAELYELDPEKFKEMVRKSPSPWFSTTQETLRTGRPVANSGVFVECHASANQILKRCQDIVERVEKMGMPQTDFSVEIDQNPV